jgi:integrase
MYKEYIFDEDITVMTTEQDWADTLDDTLFTAHSDGLYNFYQAFWALYKELSMQGKVRTEQRCPVCHKKFHIEEEIDIYCPTCKTRPTRLHIFFYDSKGYRIYSDADGEPFSSYRAAHRFIENMRKAIDDGTFSIADYIPKEVEKFRVKTLLPKWIASKKDNAPTYKRELARHAKLILKKMGELDTRKIRTFHIDDFYMELPDHLSLKSKRDYMITLKNFCYWLFRREILLRMPHFSTISPPEPVITWIDKETQLKVLDHVPEHDRPILSFMIFHQVRSGEACAMKRKDFDLSNKIVHICRAFSLNEERSRKNKKPLYLPISKYFDTNILHDKLPEAYVFTDKAGKTYTNRRLNRIWHTARKKAGVPHISLKNATRHSGASQAVNAGVDLNIISEALGHSSLQVTKKYASLNVQKMRAVVDGVETFGSSSVKKITGE